MAEKKGGMQSKPNKQPIERTGKIALQIFDGHIGQIEVQGICVSWKDR